ASDHRGDFQAALEAYDALRSEKGSGDVLYYRGNLKKKMGDLQGAMTDLNRAIELQPLDPDCYNLRVYVSWLQGDLDAAVADGDKSLRIREDQPWMRFTRALILHQQGKNHEALREYQQLISNDDKNLKDLAALRIYLLHTQLGEPQAAAKTLQNHFGGREPNQDDWEACLANFSLQHWNPKKLLDLCLTDTRKETENRRKQAYGYLALSYLMEGKRSEAEHYFRKSKDVTNHNQIEHDEAATYLDLLLKKNDKE
ncbi:MAG: tetratricopeptide repeat protein, partial [Planctomycetales bacterium]